MVLGNKPNSGLGIVDRPVGGLQPGLHDQIRSNISNGTGVAFFALFPDVDVAGKVIVAPALYVNRDNVKPKLFHNKSEWKVAWGIVNKCTNPLSSLGAYTTSREFNAGMQGRRCAQDNFPQYV